MPKSRGIRNITPEGRKKHTEAMRRFWKTKKGKEVQKKAYEGRKKYWNSPEFAESIKKCKKYWTPERRAKQSETVRKSYTPERRAKTSLDSWVRCFTNEKCFKWWVGKRYTKVLFYYMLYYTNPEYNPGKFRKKVTIPTGVVVDEK